MSRRRGNPRVQCSICSHVERARAELLLAKGDQIRATAHRLGMSEDALSRHWRAHVPEDQRAGLVLGGQALAAQQGLAVQVAEANGSVLDNYHATRAGLWQRFIAELQGGDSTLVAMLATQITKINDSIARLTGELATSPLISQTSIHMHVTQLPEFMELIEELAEVLGPHDDARRDVFAWLARRDTPPPAQLEHQSEHQETA
jgi:hypothetical protein